MRKVILLLNFLFVYLIILGQQNCPAGYVSRKVKCEGRIIEKCIPEGYSCNNCWQIVWEHCSKPGVRGGDNYTNSFENAAKLAEERMEMFKNTNCKTGNVVNYFKYEIYLNGGGNCNAIRTSHPGLLDEAKKRFEILRKRHNDEKRAFMSYLRNFPTLPGNVTKEYSYNIKLSFQRINQLSWILYSNSSENMSYINALFDDIQKKEDKIETNRQEIRNYITQMALKEKPSTQQVVSKKNDAPQKTDGSKRLNSSEEHLKKQTTSIKTKEYTSSRETENEQKKKQQSIVDPFNGVELYGYIVASGYYEYDDGGYSKRSGLRFIMSGIINLKDLSCNSKPKTISQYYECAQQWYKKVLQSSGETSNLEIHVNMIEDQNLGCKYGTERACALSRARAIEKRNKQIEGYRRNYPNHFKIIE